MVIFFCSYSQFLFSFFCNYKFLYALNSMIAIDTIMISEQVFIMYQIYYRICFWTSQYFFIKFILFQSFYRWKNRGLEKFLLQCFPFSYWDLLPLYRFPLRLLLSYWNVVICHSFQIFLIFSHFFHHDFAPNILNLFPLLLCFSLLFEYIETDLFLFLFF